ncbi:MAG: hypothetical protein QOC99_958 [Acidobacteriota bacterium]|nr:hypothetical protein [Acidobacteriota bacterium]
MSKYTNPLEHVRVATPCPADWERMVGDERVRFCDQCSLHVYNLSGMTRREAETLVTNAESRLCIRFYRRADGTILTRNCPVGLRALKQRVSRIAGAALSAMLGFFAGVGLDLGVNRAATPTMMGEMAVPASLNSPPAIPEVKVPAVLKDTNLNAVQGGMEVGGRFEVGKKALPLYKDVDAGRIRRQAKRLR